MIKPKIKKDSGLKLNLVRTKAPDYNFKNYRTILNLKREVIKVKEDIKDIHDRKNEVEDLLRMQLEKEIQRKATNCRVRRTKMMLACRAYLAKML